jgi:hypothetical protein
MIARHYEDAQAMLIEHMPSIACVMPVHVPVNPIKKYEIRSVAHPEHTEMLEENKVDSVDFTLSAYSKLDAGIDFDLIVISNENKNREVWDILDEAANVGIISQLLHRENEGFSFGAYDWFWESPFSKQYDFFLFHEQDICPAKDGWLLEIFKRFNSHKRIGAVGCVMEDHERDSRYPWKNPVFDHFGRNKISNLDGAFTFTSKKVLDLVHYHFGGLPVSKDYHPVVNELLFQQGILELGFTILAFGDRSYKGEYYCTHGVEFLEHNPMDYEKICPMLHTHAIFVNKDLSWLKEAVLERVTIPKSILSS